MVIVRVRDGGLTPAGGPVTGTPTEATLAGAFVAPQSSTDLEGRARDGAATGLTLFAPHGSDLVRTDKVKVNGVLHEIDGDIAVWEHPFTGWKPGITAELVRAAG